MKVINDGTPFGVVLSLYLHRVDEIAQEMGKSLQGMQVALRARDQLRKVIDSPEVTSTMSLSMTSLVMGISFDQVDKADPLIARYAVQFAVENRLAIAEAILTQEGGRRVH